MKKSLISLFLLTSLFSTNINITAFGTELLRDEINPENFDRSLLHKNTYTPIIIQDEFIINPGESKIQKASLKIIEDETVKSTLVNKKLQKKKYQNTILNDEPVVLLKDRNNYKKVVYTGKVNTEIGYAVIIKPLKKISTKNSHLKIKNGDKYEKYDITLPELGEEYKFKVLEDVNIEGNIVIPKNSIVSAKVDNVSARAMGGAPAELKLDNFVVKTPDGKELELNGTVDSVGYTLSPWIGLAELATTPFLFGLAVPALRVLPGGQATITPRKTYTVYYSSQPK